MTAPLDSQEAEWLQHEAEQLAKGRCPYSGGVLHRDGEAGPHAASCDMCDCFGYDPTQVKVHPRPLQVARWKVTRMRCACGRVYSGDKWSTMCEPCFTDAFGELFGRLKGHDPFGDS